MPNVNLYYLFGRILAVIVRPALLFITSNYIQVSVSVDLAICFLTSSLSFVVVSMDAHRLYYEYYFKEKRLLAAQQFIKYNINTIFLLIFSCLFAFAFDVFYAQKDVFFTINVIIYLVSEKIVDELLRFSLFEKRFYRWGKINLYRFLFIIFFLLILGFCNSLNQSNLIIFSFSVSNFLITLPLLFRLKEFFKKVYTIQQHSKDVIAKSIGSLKSNIIIWVFVLLSASTSYVDRLISLATIQNKLAAITIAATCFSLIQMGIDFFYVSAHRREFLENKLSITNTLLTRKFIKLYLATLTVSICFYGVIAFLSKAENRLDLHILIGLILMQSSIAINSIPQQILYWKDKLSKLIIVDTFFWFGVFIVTQILGFFNFSYSIIYLGLAGMFIMRLLINIKIVM